MRYFSMFSGIGGFELGIEKAWRTTIKSEEKETRNTQGDKPISKGEQRNSYHKSNLTISQTAKDTSRTLFQNRQIKGNTFSYCMESTKETFESRQPMGQRSYGILREGNGIRNDKKILLRNWNRTNARKWECIGFSEIDKYAEATYLKHFPNHHNYGDATKINPEELPDFDMLCGGFPCQSFSIAGKRLGFEDTRGTLFFDIARIVKVKRPQIIFLENVKGLLNHDNGRTFAIILATLDELGYNAEWQVLNSKHFGVPQNRERVFIIGHLRGTSGRQIFPLRKGNKKDFETQTVGTIKASYYKMGYDNPLIADFRNDEGLRKRKDNISPTIHANLHSREGTEDLTKQIFVHSLMPRSGNPKQGGTGQLSKKDGTVYCLDTGNTQGIEIEKNRIRRLTPTECERLQGFPDNWTIGSDTQRYKQCGNAVTVNVIETIVKEMIKGER